MLIKDDKIRFKGHPNLNERHTYVVLEVSENMVHFQNIASKNSFHDTMQNLIRYRYEIVEKAKEHPQLAAESQAIGAKLKIKCDHSATIDRYFSTFSFTQCSKCGKDLGPIKKEKVHG